MAYWKKLKNTDAVPVLKDELVFDTTPTVNSTNPVTSDGVARAIAGASGEVPVVTENDSGKILTAIYDEGGAAVEWAEAPSGVPEYSAAEEGKVLGVVVDGVEDTPALGWVDQPADELPSISGNAGKVLKVNSGATGVEWGEAGANYIAGNGIAISEQGAISAVGGTGITVTAGSTVQKTLTAHSQDYVPQWTPTELHMVTYMSLLDSSLVSDIQNDGIDVTLAYPFEQFAQFSSNNYLEDWQDHQNYFKAYAAIVELETIQQTSGPTYWGSTRNRLVLGEITSQWAGTSATYPTIVANTVVNYDFADVNASLSTITLADVLANPGNYCLTVLFRDTYNGSSTYDDDYSPGTCTMISSYVSGSGDYTTGSYQGTAPSAITVTIPVPAYSTTTDLGKVLTVTSNGLEWVTPA